MNGEELSTAEVEGGGAHQAGLSPVGAGGIPPTWQRDCNCPDACDRDHDND